MILTDVVIPESNEQETIWGFVEQKLAAAVQHGATQYVALGECPNEAKERVSQDLRTLCVPHEFDSAEGDSLSVLLRDAGLLLDQITFVSWVGGRVSTMHSILSTLRVIGTLPAFSALVFDYVVFDYIGRRRPNDRTRRTAMDPLASEIGDPPGRHIDPQALWALLCASGFHHIEEAAVELEGGRRLVLAVV